MNRTETKKAETDRVPRILAGCQADAKEQVAVLQTMIGNCDGKDLQGLAVIALAAENAAKAVRKLYQFNLQLNQDGPTYGLA